LFAPPIKLNFKNIDFNIDLFFMKKLLTKKYNTFYFNWFFTEAVLVCGKFSIK
jgi:hypothetical protein